MNAQPTLIDKMKAEASQLIKDADGDVVKIEAWFHSLIESHPATQASKEVQKVEETVKTDAEHAADNVETDLGVSEEGQG